MGRVDATVWRLFSTMQRRLVPGFFADGKGGHGRYGSEESGGVVVGSKVVVRFL